MSRHNFFTTFSEAVESQHYDHLFQKSLSLANASGVSVNIVRELNLHFENENGIFPLDQYIADNNIIVEDQAIYKLTKKYWIGNKKWAIICKYLDGYVYFKDHSDRQYTVIDIDDSLKLPVDENGDVIIIESEEEI
jgi:hypothetical protein